MCPRTWIFSDLLFFFLSLEVQLSISLKVSILCSFKHVSQKVQVYKYHMDWLSFRHIFRGQISVVMLIFLLFSDKILWGGRSF